MVILYNNCKGSSDKNVSIRNKNSEKDSANYSILEWYVSKIAEMNLYYYEGEDKNIIVQYPKSHSKYICIYNSVRNSSENNLINDISSIFSSVECLNIIKNSGITFNYGVRLIINPNSVAKQQDRINSNNLSYFFETKIVENEELSEFNSIAIVQELRDEQGTIHTLSKSVTKILEQVLSKLNFDYHLLESYTVNHINYLPAKIPIGYVLIPKAIEGYNDQNNEITHINIEKSSKLLLNIIEKLNE